MVDFRLPSDSELFAAAAPNPEAEAARLTAGNPEQLRALGHRLQRSGVDMDHLHGQSQRIQQGLGGGFANNGAPVYDSQAHTALMPPGHVREATWTHGVS